MRVARDTKTILITGAQGYLGKFLCRLLRNRYPDAWLVGLGSSDRETPEYLDQYFGTDLADYEALKETLGSILNLQVVFHLAAAKPTSSKTELWRVNVAGTLNLFRALKSSGVQNCRIVVAASAAEYSPNDSGIYKESAIALGHSDYGCSKAVQTEISVSLGNKLGYEVIIGRIFNIIGPGLSEALVVGRICNQVNTGLSPISLRRTDSIRDFIDVRDVVNAFCALLDNGRSGEIYNVCTGVPSSIERTLHLIGEILGSNLDISIEDGRVSNDKDMAIGVAEKIKLHTDWMPDYTLEESLRSMLRVVPVDHSHAMKDIR